MHFPPQDSLMNRKLKRTAFIVVYEYSPTVMAFIMRNNRCGERRRVGKNKTKKKPL